MEQIDSKKILIVEDESIIALSEQEILEEYGYDASIVNSGEEAIDIVACGDDIDLILMDIDLGKGIDGTLAAVKIHEIKEIPIIFLSSHTERSFVEKTEGITSYGYIVKNSGETILAASVKMAFRLAEARRKEQEKELALHRKEEENRVLINGIPDTVWVTNFSGDILVVNDKAIEILGYSREELRRIGIKGIDKSAFGQSIGQCSDPFPIDEPGIFETVHTAKDGREIPVEISISCISYRGEPAVLSVARDITYRKWAQKQIQKELEEKTALLKAVHHRMKNNMANIESLLSIQARTETNEAVVSALREAIGRVECARILYDMLLNTGGFSSLSCKVFFERLVDAVLTLFPREDDITVETSFEDFVIDDSLLFPLGVIVEELITNSLKYAFPDQRKGRIAVSLMKDGDRAGLTIEDDGIGLPEEFSLAESKGFGLMIVKILCKQLDGDISFKNHSGTAWSMLFPVSTKQRHTAETSS